MEKTSDIVGTDPKYPKIVDHSWLAPQEYDNYPSDNNPVRVVPKLSELWTHDPMQGARVIPHTTVQPLGVLSTEQKQQNLDAGIREVIREAKKAMMSGSKGTEISEHLRSLFTADQIKASAGELKKLSSEQGLLGNVYIDVSAFRTCDEAEGFLKNHRNRLAHYILFEEGTTNSTVVSTLASKFHKTPVASIVYDPNLFYRYKTHLVASGKVPADYVIDSKESLRQAFLCEPKEAPVQVSEKMAEKRLTEEQVQKGLQEMAPVRMENAHNREEAIQFSEIRPIVAFSQETLSKGRGVEELKDMLRSKYTTEDIRAAGPYLALVGSEKGLTARHLDELVEEGKLVYSIAEDLKKIGKEFPVKKALVLDEGTKRDRPVGVQASLYSLSGHTITDKWTPYKTASCEALRKGIDPQSIKAKLLANMSGTEADKVLADAVSMMNATPAGAVANKQKKNKQEEVIPVKARKVLPDESTIIAQEKELMGYFSGNNTDIEFDPIPQQGNIDVGELFNSAGLDEALK